MLVKKETRSPGRGARDIGEVRPFEMMSQKQRRRRRLEWTSFAVAVMVFGGVITSLSCSSEDLFFPGQTAPTRTPVPTTTETPEEDGL